MDSIVVVADERSPLLDSTAGEVQPSPSGHPPDQNQWLASLDVSRGVALMILADDAGGKFPSINHSPWFGATLADFVMPFFLFGVGVSHALVFEQKSSNKLTATKKVILRTLNLSIGCTASRLVVILLSLMYIGLLYGLYVPNWVLDVPSNNSTLSFPNYGLVTETVNMTESLLQAIFHSEKWGTLAFVLLEILFWCVVAGFLHRKGIFLKLQACQGPQLLLLLLHPFPPCASQGDGATAVPWYFLIFQDIPRTKNAP